MRNRPCPRCKELGRDKTGDHLFLMRDGHTWACSKKIHPLYFERDGVEVSSTLTPPKETMEEISELPYEGIRGITKSICERYGVRVSFSEVNYGEVEKHFYPITKDKKVVNYKIRVLPKKFTMVKSGIKETDLFGMDSSPYHPDTVVICEGELDAMSAKQMLSAYPKVMAVSLPNGGSHITDIINNISWLQSVDSVVICPDQDEVGLSFVDKVFLHLPKMRVMKFSEKDANDMLNAGKKEEFIDSFVNAKPHKPSCIVGVRELKTQAMVAPTMGLSYPFEDLTKFTYGLRPHRLIGIGAGPGCGKTTFVKAIQTHLMYEHKEPIGVFSLEEIPKDVARELAGFVMNKPLQEPGCAYSDSELSEVLDSFEDLLYVYKHKGHQSWSDIVTGMKQMIGMGIKWLFIDPLSALVAPLDSSEANRYLGEAMNDMMLLKDQEEVTIFHINHLNNPSAGKDHGAGGKVYAGQFSGSRAMWKFSTDIWGLERDQCADDDSRDIMNFVSLKYRKPSKPGSFQLKYNSATGKLSEIKHNF